MAALFWFVIFLICLPIVIGAGVRGDLSGLLVPAGLTLAILAVRRRTRRRQARLARRAQQFWSLYHGRPEGEN